MRHLQASQLTSTPKQSYVLAHKVSRRKSITFETHQRKQRRKKPGEVALRQIKHYQKTTDLLIRLAPFARLVKEIADELNLGTTAYKWKASAISALQSAVEAYIIALMEDTNKAAIHAKRVTIRPEDLHLVRDIRGSVNVFETF